MADKKVSVYDIQLSIEGADQAKQKLKQVEQSFSHLSDIVDAGIGNNLVDAQKEAEKLANEMKKVAANGEDAKDELAVYGKSANMALADLERQAAKLNDSLNESGKANRERLQALKAEKAALGDSAQDRQRAKQIEKEILKLQNQVIDATDEELKEALKRNTAIRATLRLAQTESRQIQENAKYNKKMIEYAKADLKAIQEKIKAQFKFIDALKTTEGRYKALKKAAGAIGKGAMKVAKAGAIGVGGLLGGAMAIGGSAISHADSIVEREREANRLKIGGSPDEKQQILGDLQVSTGRDYTTIVDAINRVTSVLGTGLSHDELLQAARTEIMYPGASAIFRQQNTGAVTSKDYAVYMNRMKAIQGATGASVDQIQGATDRIANMRQNSFSNANMTELLSLYSGLQNSGAYDSQDELDRAFNRFVRMQKNSGQSVYDFAKTFDWTKGVYGATNKEQARTAIGKLDFSKIEAASKVNDDTYTQSKAEATAQKMREFEEKKNMLLMKVLEALAPIIENLDVNKLTPFFDGIAKFMEKVGPHLGKLVTFLTDSIQKLIQSVEAIYNGLKNSKLGQWMGFKDEDKGPRGLDDVSVGTSGQARANGGVAMMPSIAGERGPEMVVPLDYSRNARGRELTANLIQHFNMSGNETTVLSLAQSVKSRAFTRAMADSAFMSARLGR